MDYNNLDKQSYEKGYKDGKQDITFYLPDINSEEELIEIFNKKWATIILSLESKFGGCNLA